MRLITDSLIVCPLKPSCILHAASGAHGFGYDPLFWVPERNVSSAELSPADKNQISHRARAMALLRQRLSLK